VYGAESCNHVPIGDTFYSLNCSYTFAA